MPRSIKQHRVEESTYTSENIFNKKDTKMVTGWMEKSYGPIVSSWLEWNRNSDKDLGTWKCPPLNSMQDVIDLLSIANDASITTMFLGPEFNEVIPAGVFNHLQCLSLNSKFNQPLGPNTLNSHTVIFGQIVSGIVQGDFNQPIPPEVFSEKAQIIMLPITYSQQIKASAFPKNGVIKILYQGTENIFEKKSYGNIIWCKTWEELRYQ